MRHPTRGETTRAGGVLVYLLVLVSLQIFLMVVALEGVLAHDAGLAVAAAALSVGVFVIAAGLHRLLPDA